MGRRHFNPWIFAGDLFAANMQVATVLWHRLSSPQSDAEKARMISEKIAATSSGAFEVQKAALRLSRDAARGKVSPGRSAHAAAELGAAASRPALKTVRANAKRLRKRSRRKKS
jgi:hypothetical protein